MKNLYKGLATAFCALAIFGCNDDISGSTKETKTTINASNHAANIVGMPAITNFEEKKNLKRIYELRDKPNLVTYTYRTDMNGNFHSVCPTNSVGYPFPYSTQMSAPKAARVVRPVYPNGSSAEWHIVEADQPEPNQLYMPSSAEATWVLCVNPENGELAPTYVEEKVMTYLFKMK